MARLTKTGLFKPASRAETLLDKTTRAAKEILDEETSQRDAKTERLRKARLEQETGASAAPAGGSRGKPRAKTGG